MSRQHALHDVWRLLLAEADRTVRTRLGLALVLVGTGGLLAALAPLALKAMVDAVADTSQARDQQLGMDVLTLGTAYIFALFGGRMLADVGPLLTGTADQRLYRRLTRRSFSHVLGLPMAYLLGRRQGELVRSIDLGRAGCQLVVAHAVNSILPVLVEAVAMGVVLAQVGQPALVAAIGVTACAYLAIFTAGARRLTKLAGDVSRMNLEQHALMTDSLLHCETLRCFVAEPAACHRVDTAGEVLEQRWLQLIRMRAKIGVAVTLTFTLSMATSLFLAGSAVADGSLTVGGFVLANVYMLQIVRPLEAFGSAVRDISQALGFIGPLLDILREPPETTPTKTDTPADSIGAGRPLLVFEKVCFGYPMRQPVFHGLDLEIIAGRTTAIVGASGSGKSSLVRLLLRLYQPQSGRILLDGRPLSSLPAAELRAGIGLVPQDTSLFHDTIACNIALGRPGATPAEIEQAARRAQLHDFIAALPDRYDTLVGERGLQLSGGERQRLAIARALLIRPVIFVLDEATSMLDSRTEAAVLSGLQEAAVGCTTIVIAHRLSTVMNADEIVVLDNGWVAERGTHAGLLLTGGHYAQMWQRQMHHGA
jgi:ABC-type multidrug transport system fused ATPase/permease subunit